jgi:hypothetical protein
MQLRDYQSAAVEAVLRDFQTARSTLAVLPVGSGKMRAVNNICNNNRAYGIAKQEAIIAQQQKGMESIMARLKEQDSKIDQVRNQIQFVRPAPQVAASGW